MRRRDILTLIAATTGCALIGYAEFGSAQRHGDEASAFAPSDIGFFDEVAEVIIPRTDTPGAKDAKVGDFIATYAQACYSLDDLEVLKTSIAAIEAEMQQACGARFLDATPAQRVAVLTRIDRVARAHAAKATANAAGRQAAAVKPHYFTLIKQLTLLGFFTSEPGATKVARYREIPGHYTGDVPYRGEGFWSWA